ncbi:hypothetical protein MASR1M8_24390 [Thermomonas brevis]
MAAESRWHAFGRAGLATWLLAAACAWAALLWLGALLGMGGRVADAVPVVAGTLPTPAAAKPDRIGPLTQYASAAARPLFTQDRRPRSFLASAPESGETGAEASRLDFVLTGVLISPQVRLAVLQPTAGGESQRVREGAAPEGAAGWRLVEVQPRRAVFEGGDGQVVLDLRSFGVAGVPAVPMPRPMAAMSGDPEAIAAAQAAAAAAAADAAAAAAAAGRPMPLPQPPTQQDDPSAEARVEAIRRRIEARRAQMQADAQQRNNPGPGSGGVPGQ